MFILLLSLGALLLLLWTAKKPKNFPPGPPTIPIFGSAPFVKLDNFHYVLEEMRKNYGPVIGLKIGWKNIVAVCGKEEVEETLRRDEFQGRPPISPFGDGIFFSEGEFWTHQRRFALRHLREFGLGKSIMEDTILEEVDYFLRTYFENCGKVQVSGLFNTSAINILWAMIAGKRYSHSDPEFKALLACIEKLFRSGTAVGGFSIRYPIISKLFPFLKMVKEEKDTERLITQFMQKSFKEHRQTMEGEPRDFIDVYLSELDNGKNLHSSFSEETLTHVCTDFFSAGAESIGNSLGFNILYCVLYPEWQDRLHEEIVSVIGKERKPSLADKKSLHKVEAFMAEVSRRNTIASTTAPHKCIAETTLNGYTIPKDTMMIVSLYAVLQDKNYWGDPENFRPERFLGSDGSFVKDKSLPIFGSGKRVCPGESLARNVLFLFFTTMIQRYRFGIPNGDPKPSTVCLSGFTQAPQPFEVTITPRS